MSALSKSSAQERALPSDQILLFTFDPQGLIKFANHELAQLSQRTPEQLQGQSFETLKHSGMPDALLSSMWSTLRSGRSWQGLVQFCSANAQYYWAHMSVNPIMHQGRVAEYQAVLKCPQRSDVARAQALYLQLKNNQTSALTKPMMGFSQRLLAGVAAGLVVTIGLHGVLPWFGAACGAMATMALLWWQLQPFAQLTEQARQVQDDPIANATFSGGQDDLCQINTALTVLNGTMSGAMARMADSASSLDELGQHLQTSMIATQQRVEQQSLQTVTAAAAVEEMTVSFGEVVDNTDSVASALKQSQEIANQGSVLLTEVQGVIANLSTDVNRIAAAIGTIERDSQAVSNVLDVIRSIAEQTNLLALNAAIEAARAGDSGRGFAVVADEVRSLASRTAESTIEIETIIKQFLDATQEAGSAMSEGQQAVDHSVELTQRVDQSFETLRQAVDHSNGVCGQISAAMHQQRIVTQDIAQSIQTISDLAQANSMDAEQTTKCSEALAALANKQAKLSQQFWADSVQQPHR